METSEKIKLTPNEDATSDYLICFETLFDYVDYFVVNVSSPNTPNLRELQEKEPLTKLLQITAESKFCKTKTKTNPFKNRTRFNKRTIIRYY